MRTVLRMAVAGFVFVSLGGVALADQSVERSTPFSDYRQAATDESAVLRVPRGTPARRGGADGHAHHSGVRARPGRQHGSAGAGRGLARGRRQRPGSGGAPGSGSGVVGTTVDAPSSGLPFTGLDLLTIMLLGALLVAAGLALAALARVRRRPLAR